MTYTYDLNRFHELFDKKNHDFRVTLASLKKLKNKKGDLSALMGKL
jgi:hypothetical protein